MLLININNSEFKIKNVKVKIKELVLGKWTIYENHYAEN